MPRVMTTTTAVVREEAPGEKKQEEARHFQQKRHPGGPSTDQQHQNERRRRRRAHEEEGDDEEEEDIFAHPDNAPRHHQQHARHPQCCNPNSHPLSRNSSSGGGSFYYSYPYPNVEQDNGKKSSLSSSAGNHETKKTDTMTNRAGGIITIQGNMLLSPAGSVEAAATADDDDSRHQTFPQQRHSVCLRLFDSHLLSALPTQQQSRLPQSRHQQPLLVLQDVQFVFDGVAGVPKVTVPRCSSHRHTGYSSADSQQQGEHEADEQTRLVLRKIEDAEEEVEEEEAAATAAVKALYNTPTPVHGSNSSWSAITKTTEVSHITDRSMKALYFRLLASCADCISSMEVALTLCHYVSQGSRSSSSTLRGNTKKRQRNSSTTRSTSMMMGSGQLQQQQHVLHMQGGAVTTTDKDNYTCSTSSYDRCGISPLVLLGGKRGQDEEEDHQRLLVGRCGVSSSVRSRFVLSGMEAAAAAPIEDGGEEEDIGTAAGSDPLRAVNRTRAAAAAEGLPPRLVQQPHCHHTSSPTTTTMSVIDGVLSAARHYLPLHSAYEALEGALRDALVSCCSSSSQGNPSSRQAQCQSRIVGVHPMMDTTRRCVEMCSKLLPLCPLLLSSACSGSIGPVPPEDLPQQQRKAQKKADIPRIPPPPPPAALRIAASYVASCALVSFLDCPVLTPPLVASFVPLACPTLFMSILTPSEVIGLVTNHYSNNNNTVVDDIADDTTTIVSSSTYTHQLQQQQRQSKKKLCIETNLFASILWLAVTGYTVAKARDTCGVLKVLCSSTDGGESAAATTGHSSPLAATGCPYRQKGKNDAIDNNNNNNSSRGGVNIFEEAMSSVRLSLSHPVVTSCLCGDGVHTPSSSHPPPHLTTTGAVSSDSTNSRSGFHLIDDVRRRVLKDIAPCKAGCDPSALFSSQEALGAVLRHNRSLSQQSSQQQPSAATTGGGAAMSISSLQQPFSQQQQQHRGPSSSFTSFGASPY